MRAASRAFRRLIRLLAAALLAVTLHAAPATVAPPPKEISETLSAQLPALRALTDAKNYPAALVLLAPLTAAAPADSYDLLVLSQLQAQIILNHTGPTAPAIAPLETALRLGDAHAFLDARQTLDLLYLLTQLHYQQAAESKDPAAQRAAFDHAAAHIRRWLDLTPAPTEDALLLAASIFYQQAQALTTAPVGTRPPPVATVISSTSATNPALTAAITTAERGLTLTLRPNEEFYLILLAARQQLNQPAPAADLLELLVARSPANADYWRQLSALYLILAADATDPRENQRLNLRALLTLERAQALGLLTTPKDNFNLAGLCFNLHQPARALALLETGLRTGAIEATHANWELLATACQQVHAEPRALADLQTAASLHPRDAHYDWLLARVHYSLGDLPAARALLESALAKGNLDRPAPAALLLAYISHELHDPASATRALDQAAAAQPPPTPTELEDITRLRQALAAAPVTARPPASP